MDSTSVPTIHPAPARSIAAERCTPRLTIAGTPEAIASTSDTPKFSWCDGRPNRDAPAISVRFASPSTQPANVIRSAAPPGALPHAAQPHTPWSPPPATTSRHPGVEPEAAAKASTKRLEILHRVQPRKHENIRVADPNVRLRRCAARESSGRRRAGSPCRATAPAWPRRPPSLHPTCSESPTLPSAGVPPLPEQQPFSDSLLTEWPRDRAYRVGG